VPEQAADEQFHIAPREESPANERHEGTLRREKHNRSKYATSHGRRAGQAIGE
jgi:hypothetical protein